MTHPDALHPREDANAEPRGMVFDIQHYCLHDGPGVRSTVFLKGCPLSCRWCSNPESQSGQPQLLYYRHLCVGCGACVAACPNRALILDEDGLHLDRDLCAACGLCVPACLQNARALSGRQMTVQQVCDEVRQHWRIFMQSGGGVTCGGGEAMAQPAFLLALLDRLHTELGFHTCLDTSGFAPWEVLVGLLPHLDLILLDIKHMDGAKHRAATGVDNQPILRNAAALGRLGFPVTVRLPLIPGFNDDEQNIHALGAFLREHRLPAVEIMPYHELGRSKYDALGREYCPPPTKEPKTRSSEKILRGYGLEATVHGT